MTPTEMKKAVLAACADAIAGTGFKPTRPANSFAKPVSDDVEWWIGLNLLQARPALQLGINPTVGVRLKHVESTMSELASDWPIGAPPLITRPLGYLMPDKRFKTWMAEPGTNLQEMTEDLARSIETYAIPFLEEFSDPVVLGEVSRIKGLMQENQRAKAIPIILAQSMENDKAAEMIAQELQSLKGRQDVYAESYREFAGKFAQKFDISL